MMRRFSPAYFLFAASIFALCACGSSSSDDNSAAGAGGDQGAAGQAGAAGSGPSQCTQGDETTAELCSDGCDNDGNGYKDTEDYACCGIVPQARCPQGHGGSGGGAAGAGGGSAGSGGEAGSGGTAGSGPDPSAPWTVFADVRRDEYGPKDMIRDAHGDLYLVGDFGFALPLEGITLQAQRPSTFVLKLTATGHVLWARKFEGQGSVSAQKIRFDSSGHVVIVGTVDGTIDFGSGPVEPVISDPYVLRLDSNGNYLDSTVLVEPDSHIGEGLEIDGDQIVVLARSFFSFHDHPIAHLFRLDSRLQPVQRVELPGELNTLSLLSTGDAIVCGALGAAYKVSRDGQSETIEPLASMSADSKFFTSTVDSSDNIYLAGFRDPTLGADVDWSGQVTVAKYPWRHPEQRWQYYLGEIGQNGAHSIAVDTDGTILVGGTLSGPADLGDGWNNNVHIFGLLIARFGQDGELLDGKLWGQDVRSSVNAIIPDGLSYFMAGQFGNQADLGTGEFHPEYGYTMFVSHQDWWAVPGGL